MAIRLWGGLGLGEEGVVLEVLEGGDVGDVGDGTPTLPTAHAQRPLTHAPRPWQYDCGGG